MTGSPDERRFNDDEFALILRKAAELQSEAVRSGSSAGGFSLAEIEEIAAEAGIDPARIREAASLVSAAGGTDEFWERVMGGPWSFRLEHTVPGTVAQEHLGKLLDVIRREARAQGEVEHVLDSLEWSDKDDAGETHVNIVPRDGNTTIQILADRGPEAGALFFAGPFMGLITGMIASGTMDLGSGLATVLTILATTTVGLAGVRSLWHYHSLRWQEKTRRLLEGVTRTARELAEPPEGKEPGSPPSIE